MVNLLPTIASPTLNCGEFLASVRLAFDSGDQHSEVRMYFYGATQSGWDEIRDHAKAWLGRGPSRKITAFIGTDDAVTEPEVLVSMRADGVDVRLVVSYSGIFHPKVIVFAGAPEWLLLSGSNNLTRRGLSSNVEFATSVRIHENSKALADWEGAIGASSEILNDAALKEYRVARNKRMNALRKSKQTWQFTWNRRIKSRLATPKSIEASLPIPLVKGTLVYEVMPKETGQMGQQVQILKPLAITYFGLGNVVGESLEIQLRNVVTESSRGATMTHNPNITMRLSIHEASFTERPCFLLFRKIAPKSFDFAVVSRAVDPSQYACLDTMLKARKGHQRRYKLM